ncbi:2,5-dioxopentanoate dehydrogenase [Candidatus Lokiarchaeum ossiferum]|uniref:L-glutamate gamma-semialdehyde dehydrogenase n=1 Tax=Candidatus Lokiarchaeum ossiferum TaxID=2951803 RepID=A0ABY6HV19_9ARCH|nr:2,5-dioxopentanoate dehydrogenase [Candidatus Lokiarchaeum sp. B-35]
MECVPQIVENDVDQIPTYKKNSKERSMLLKELERMKNHVEEIPLIINGKKIRSSKVIDIVSPHDHSQILAKAHLATKEHLKDAISSALDAHEQWSELDACDRVNIFRKAAELLAGPKRIENIAAIMLNQSKTPYEAEIDLAEMIDFLNYNSKYLEELFAIQPKSYVGEENEFEWRPLEGFILAIPPFNFYSIGGNLAAAPAVAGNVVLWKPARSVIFANYKIMEVLLESGLPPGVINFVPFDSQDAGIVINNPNLAGIHFTGSYDTLIKIWQQVGLNLRSYRNFPRIVGETGGKDFIMVHQSAPLQHTAMNIIRGSFEYQGQKCSAASRVYIPENQWSSYKQIILETLPNFKYGDVSSLEVAGGSIIDEKSFRKIVEYLNYAKNHPESYEIITGGEIDETKGWFIDPTVILAKDSRARLMEEEIFGPIVTVYVYPENEFEQILHICDATSPYALTGAIFATDIEAIALSKKVLRYAAGNFYINDKPTGAIVGRQPFGGARASGTNDKAGSKLNILRWLSPRTIKTNLVRIDDWKRSYLS